MGGGGEVIGGVEYFPPTVGYVRFADERALAFGR